MDPTEIMFIADYARQKGSCKGCTFQDERSTVCRVAASEAVKRGLPDCEYPDVHGKSVIYLVAPHDPRQQDIFNTERQQ